MIHVMFRAKNVGKLSNDVIYQSMSTFVNRAKYPKCQLSAFISGENSLSESSLQNEEISFYKARSIIWPLLVSNIHFECCLLQKLLRYFVLR